MQKRRYVFVIAGAVLIAVGASAAAFAAFAPALTTNPEVPAPALNAIPDSSAASGPGQSGRAEHMSKLGARRMTSPEEARGTVPFGLRIPDSLGSQERTGLWVTMDGPELGAGTRGEARAPAERVVYADYGAVGLVQYLPGGEKVSVPAEEYVSGKLSGSDGNTRTKVAVDGIPAAAWSKGKYEIVSDGQSLVVEHGSSVVTWVQDGVVLTVSSESGPYDGLLPLAVAVSKTASGHD